jgi:hypothetical protein
MTTNHIEIQKQRILNKFKRKRKTIQIALPNEKRARLESSPQQNGNAFKLQVLLEWFHKNGITWDDNAIKICSGESNGFSVIAVNNLSVDQSVCSIPKTAILSAKTSSISNIIEKEELGGGLGLTLCLMYEIKKGTASKWYGYLQSVPEYEDLPIFWNDDHLEYLTGTELSNESVKTELELLRDDYNSIIKPIIQKNRKIFDSNMNFELYKKATSLVASRAFTIDDYHDLAMLPLGDLFNHKTGSENIHMVCDSDVCEYCGSSGACEHVAEERNIEIQKDNSSNNTIEMIISKPVKISEEVFNVYEDLGNAKLLNKYGYTHMDNPCDIVSVDNDFLLETFISKDKTLKQRWKLWSSTAIVDEEDIEEDDEPTRELYIRSDGTFSEDFIQLLHILTASDKVYKQWYQNNNQMIQYFENHANDPFTQAMNKILLAIVKVRLELYHPNTSSDTDLQEYETTIDQRKKWALILRIGEKQILEKLITSLTL